MTASDRPAAPSGRAERSPLETANAVMEARSDPAVVASWEYDLDAWTTYSDVAAFAAPLLADTLTRLDQLAREWQREAAEYERLAGTTRFDDLAGAYTHKALVLRDSAAQLCALIGPTIEEQP